MKAIKILWKGNCFRALSLILPLLVLCSSCKKYLEAKSDQSITTPATIDDLEGLMNNYSFVNADYSGALEVASDNFYLTNTDFLALAQRQRDFYTWTKTADIGADYTAPYQGIAYTNIVLETLPGISGSGQRKNIVRGNALFVRGSYHFWLAQLFAPAYDAATASTDLGIPLRLTADIEEKPLRASLADTYASVLADLKQAVPLLPDMPVAKYTPGKAAAYGMLSRICLAMRDYRQAGLYADSCLKIYGAVIDYNSVLTTASQSFAQFNNEVIYDARSLVPAALSQSRAKIDAGLYASYAANDLRKSIFFKQNTDGSQAFKGSYTGQTTAYLFTGIAVDEVMLNKAECAARAGDLNTALQALNNLLVNRWKKGSFTPYSGTDQQQVLSLILLERRKELIFRGLRWIDLRRLNKEPTTAQTLQRNLNGTIYTLAPNSIRYVFQLDQNAVNISGLPQNP